MDSQSRQQIIEYYLEQEENIRVSERLWREYRLGRDVMLAVLDKDDPNLAVLTRYTAACAFLGALSIEQKNPALRDKIYFAFLTNMVVAGVEGESALDSYLGVEAKWQEHLEIFKMQTALKNSGCAGVLLLSLLAGAVLLIVSPIL